MTGLPPLGRARALTGRLRTGGRRWLAVLLTDVLGLPMRSAPADAPPSIATGLPVAAVVAAYERATGPSSPWSAPGQWGLLSRETGQGAALAAALRRQRRGGGDARVVARELRRACLLADPPRTELLAVTIEAAAVVVGGLAGGAPRRPGARGDRPLVVVDVRCLQPGEYDTRGVGKHALALLLTLVGILAEDPRRPRLVGLVDPEAVALPPAVAALLGTVVAHAAELPVGDVLLFLHLSPMTDDGAVDAPFLAAPWIRTAAAVYDLIPLRHPWRYLPDEVARAAYESRLLALHAYDRLLPISRATADDLVALGGLPALRLAVTGVADPLGEPGATTGAEREAAPARPAADAPGLGSRYALAATGADARKDLPCTVAGYALARSRGVDLDRLVVVGRLSSAQVDSAVSVAVLFGLDASEVSFVSDVGDAELAGLYARARVVVVTSIAEGFSLPVAEAVRRGVPVVATDIPPHRELLGEGAWLAAARDPVGVAEAMVAVLAAPEAVLLAQRGALDDLASPAAVDRRAASEMTALLQASPAEDGPDGPVGRRRLALVTPWRPQVSGISDCSAATVAALADVVAVEVFTEAVDPVPGAVPVRELTVEPYLDPGSWTVLSVLGNSLLHLTTMELVRRFGGPVLAHDSRMFEVYLAARGWEQTAELVAGTGGPMGQEQSHRTLHEPDLLPRLGFAEISPHARPLIVHSRPLAARLREEGGTQPLVLPFAPYTVPAPGLDRDRVESARARLGLGDEMVVASFGLVDIRTKGADHLVAAVRWCELWGARPVLHVVGPVTDSEREALSAMARRSSMVTLPRFHGHVGADDFQTWLLAADVGVQLRRLRLGVSGALADCIAHGLPTVATEGIAEVLDAPSYVVRVPHEITSTLLAEKLFPLLVPRIDRVDALEGPRREYLQRRNMDGYARRLVQLLDGGELGAWS